MRSIIPMTVVLGLALVLSPVQSPAVELEGNIRGIELALQTSSHGAIFLVLFHGSVDGRWRFGWGFVEAQHEPLPGPGDESLILGGGAVLFIGRNVYEATLGPGEISLPLEGPEVYSVVVLMDFGESHKFEGDLDHTTWIPQLRGVVYPAFE